MDKSYQNAPEDLKEYDEPQDGLGCDPCDGCTSLDCEECPDSPF